ncbi:hypothetical protein SAMN04488057_11729 [Cyclobacterium lianum]|uniref:C-terminal domain of CHU protein family protein n=1 Tax=Cyclobacterium lianum TaxID=388280 RepID=A0A1M7QFF5_9BACT|nr:hypothetical protein [Cyclobacterium lianum]SHN29341.1 hypothetical protein SAMN04488057_11729 [Cyclobacterium lianum]
MSVPIRLSTAVLAVTMILLMGNTSTVISPSFRAEPNLQGPEGVCLNGAFAYGDFSAGGDPATDRYIWSILDASGFEIFYESGGAQAQEISFPFTSTGTYQVNLRVIRADNQNYYQGSLTVTVERGPSFVLPPDVVFCGNDPVTLQALDPNDPNFGRYTIEWLNPANTVLGTGNTYLATEPGRYYAKVSSVACEAVATTFVGPSIAVDVNASAREACLGSTVSYRPDAPYLASWSYSKDGQQQRTLIAEAYELNLDTDDLEGLGDYTIFFSVEDPERPGCNVEKSFPLTVSAAPDFSLTKIRDAESCASGNGIFEITANTTISSITIPGATPETINQIPAGDTRTITGLEPRLYTVSASVGTCTIRKSISIENENPDEGIDFEVSSTPSQCTEAGAGRGILLLDFKGLSVSGSYRISSENGNSYSDDFQNQTQIEVEVPKGNYRVEVSDNDACSNTKSEFYEVAGPAQVSFSVPSSLTVCERYALSPQTSQNLLFTLTDPSGNEVASEDDGSFIIDQTGSYRLMGTSADPGSPLCPRTRTMDVVVNEPLEYDFSKRIIDCFGNQIFTAELFDANPNDVIIRWMAPDRTILGRDVEFFPPSTGTFLLEVQPRASSSCPVNPISFEVSIQANDGSISIEGSPLCSGDNFTRLEAVVTGDPSNKVEWYRVDPEAGNTWLFELDGQLEIEVEEPGVYEAVLRNEINCQLESAVYEVTQFETQSLNLENVYELCSAENISPNISPGDFASYSWVFEGAEVSDASSFRPLSPGNYELTVIDNNGCRQVQSFDVEEGCAVLVRYPNALVPGDPDRKFVVFADEDIDWVEIFIYNRNGALVYHCESQNEGGSLPLCQWEGMVDGTEAVTGSYPVIVKYRSEVLGLEKTEKSAITVIGN